MTGDSATTGRQHFLGDLAIALRIEDDRTAGALTAVPEVCTPDGSRIRTGVLCTMADIVAGKLAAMRTAPRLSVTVDLACIVYRDAPDDRVLAEAIVLKAGRTTIVTETRFHGCRGSLDQGEPDGPPFATCLTTFVASGRPGDVLPASAATRIPIMGNGVPALAAPILERIGSVEHAPGVLDVELAPDVVNSAGLLQGGAVALVAEGAAQSAATAAFGARGSVLDLDVRYLDALRVGPARTSAALLGEAAGGQSWWRVELRDMGNDNRLGTVAVARFAIAG